MTAGPVAPRTTERLETAPVRSGHVAIEGGYWLTRQRLNRETTIPYGMRLLEETNSLENFRIAAARSSSGYRTPVFRDSDVYKVLEAIAWERQHGTDPAQQQFLASTADLVASAQQPDGYLHTYVQVVEGGRRFADPATNHELYCAGHLIQAAIADLRGGGDPEGIARTAGRFASYLSGALRTDQKGFVPGHPEIETALAELYRQTGEADLLDLAGELIARRGRKALARPPFGPAYFQDDLPVADARQIRGHAVRALYLLAGVTDVYTEAGDPALIEAALAQWDDMIGRKTYLTGGVGSRHEGESFGDPFELPSDRSYCETCAAIASIMWNWRLLLLTGERRFADVMERTLFNAFASGYGLDGTSFFYENTLHARIPVQREPWYDCACCPPNVMRLLASLEHYFVTSSDPGVQLHQFFAGRIGLDHQRGRIDLQIDTGYPFDGAVTLRVLRAPSGPFELALRAPGWATDLELSLNGRALVSEPAHDGYLRVRRTWSASDELLLDLPLPVRRTVSAAWLDATRGSVAFERGPLVYCVEGVDVPVRHSVQGVFLDRAMRAPGTQAAAVGGESLVALTFSGLAAEEPPPAWPYLAADGTSAGTEPLTCRPVELRAVPYYAWANRGPSDMRVWLPWRP